MRDGGLQGLDALCGAIGDHLAAQDKLRREGRPERGTGEPGEPAQQTIDDAQKRERRLVRLLALLRHATDGVGDFVTAHGPAVREQRLSTAAQICVVLHRQGVVPRLRSLMALCEFAGVQPPPEQTCF